MDSSPPGSSVHGALQARVLEWVAIPFSRRSSPPWDRIWVFCIAGVYFTVWAIREAPWHIVESFNFILPVLIKVTIVHSNRFQCHWMNSQNKSTFHPAMNAEHSVFFTIKGVGCCSKSNLLLFHCGAYSKTFHQPPLPQASQLTPSIKAHSVPRSWEGITQASLSQPLGLSWSTGTPTFPRGWLGTSCSWWNSATWMSIF